MTSGEKPAAEDKTDNAEQREQWLEENRNAILAYNRFVEQHGCFSDGLRCF